MQKHCSSDFIPLMEGFGHLVLVKESLVCVICPRSQESIGEVVEQSEVELRVRMILKSKCEAPCEVTYSPTVEGPSRARRKVISRQLGRQ